MDTQTSEAELGWPVKQVGAPVDRHACGKRNALLNLLSLEDLLCSPAQHDAQHVCHSHMAAHTKAGVRAYCSMASSPAEQMSTILTPAVHFFTTPANTPVPVGGIRYTLCNTLLSENTQEPPALLVMSAAALYFVTTSDCKPHTRQHSLSFACRARCKAAISNRILTLLRSSSSSSRSFSLSDILCLSVYTHTSNLNTTAEPRRHTAISGRTCRTLQGSGCSTCATSSAKSLRA